MILNLPKPVAAYFIADEADGEAVSQCFTDGAVVKDEETPTTAAPLSKNGRMMPR